VWPINPTMTQAKPRFFDFEDYLAYDDGSDNLYELFNGELVPVPPESGRNSEIINLLFAQLLPVVGFRLIRSRGLEIEVRGEPKNRFPDLTVLQPEHAELLQQRDTIRLSMPPPRLVIEVVSPGNVQRDRDYIAKRHQYEDRGIPEYWIVDPVEEQILLLQLVGGTYQGQVYQNGTMLQSLIIPEVKISANQVFHPD
jgi:Uma2 family endonuclease